MLEMFTITTSGVVLLAVTLVVCLLSVLLATGVKWLLNEKAWGGELFDSGWLVDEVFDVLTPVDGYYIKRGGRVYHLVKDALSGKYVFRYESNLGEWWHITKDYGFNWKHANSELHSNTKVYDTIEDAINDKKRKVFTNRSFSRIYKLIAAALTLDLLLILFKLNPFVTGLTVIIVGVCLSIRWISGKLADNVGRTGNHEERISKLEGVKDDK